MYPNSLSDFRNHRFLLNGSEVTADLLFNLIDIVRIECDDPRPNLVLYVIEQIGVLRIASFVFLECLRHEAVNALRACCRNAIDSINGGTVNCKQFGEGFRDWHQSLRMTVRICLLESHG